MFPPAKVVITARAILQTGIGVVDPPVALAALLAYPLDEGRVGLPIGCQKLLAMFQPAPFLSAVAKPSLHVGRDSHGCERSDAEEQQQPDQQV